MNISLLEKNIIDGHEITFKEALELSETKNLEELYEGANNIRKYFVKNNYELCSIINAKSGKCTENCTYCAQSKYYNTGVLEYPLVSNCEALEMAKYNEENGVDRFSLVTSGRGLTGSELDGVLKIYEELKEKSNIKLCASHGILNYEDMVKLKESGVIRYHHNLESSRKYYSNICTTHNYDDRINTILNAQKAGLEVCSGGILGLGESMIDRIEMAFELKRLSIKSIPINILSPIKGTPLGNSKVLPLEEILKSISIFRFINADADIRYAGGRTNLGDYQEKGLKCGINAALTGNFLTTVGNKSNDDIKMFEESGFMRE